MKISIRKRIIGAVLLISALTFTGSQTFANVSGTQTKRNFSVCSCSISSMTVQYSLESLLQEPVVNGSFKWTASENTSNSCLNYTTKIYLNVGSKFSNLGYIELSPAVPESREGYGYNTKGSPSWGNLICDKGGNSCISSDRAKSAWNDLFVSSFDVVADCSSQNSNRENGTDSDSERSSGNTPSSCDAGPLPRQQFGYERFRCSDCSVAKIAVTTDQSGLKKYDGYSDLWSAVQASCN